MDGPIERSRSFAVRWRSRSPGAALGRRRRNEGRVTLLACLINVLISVSAISQCVSQSSSSTRSQASPRVQISARKEEELILLAGCRRVCLLIYIFGNASCFFLDVKRESLILLIPSFWILEDDRITAFSRFLCNRSICLTRRAAARLAPISSILVVSALPPPPACKVEGQAGLV